MPGRRSSHTPILSDGHVGHVCLVGFWFGWVRVKRKIRYCSLLTKKNTTMTTTKTTLILRPTRKLPTCSLPHILAPHLFPFLKMSHFISVLFRSVFGYEGPSNVLKVVESGGTCFRIIFPSYVRWCTAYYILKLS